MVIKGHFAIPIYQCYVNVILSDNLKRVINFYLRKAEVKQLDYEPGAYAFSPDDGSSNYYLFLDINDVTFTYLNHEKSHVVDFILQERGIKKQDEPRAFLDGFISDKLVKFLKKRKIKIK
jgi:hypothetical protein